jgi:hypothetical protein
MLAIVVQIHPERAHVRMQLKHRRHVMEKNIPLITAVIVSLPQKTLHHLQSTIQHLYVVSIQISDCFQIPVSENQQVPQVVSWMDVLA